MLKKRLQTFLQLIEEYGLSIDMTLRMISEQS